jgi:hypothetical protein
VGSQAARVTSVKSGIEEVDVDRRCFHRAKFIVVDCGLRLAATGVTLCKSGNTT